MQVGFGLLRLSPAQLWAMTPRELAAAIDWLSPPPQQPSRTDLTALMQRFPDSRPS
jgi:uncharacterized phage protein (TIGR02216 family)